MQNLSAVPEAAMNLSSHFTLSDLTKSDTAARRGIDNAPGEAEIGCLRLVCERILEPVRARFGPFRPSSGFRCLALNRAIGSGDTSQHIRGEAADFEVPGVANFTLARWIADNLEYDQVILEFYTPGVPDSGWVHCSVRAAGNRGQQLTINRSGVTRGLVA
jgi:zinc D-Ala-D-Ala carboxypeptidase